MKKQVFIGVDVSKETLDVSFISNTSSEDIPHQSFTNNKSGFKALIKWLEKESKYSRIEFLFCMEHTGIYTLELCCFLENLKVWKCLENALQIKKSMGIQRGKTDKADSKVIAEYCQRFSDKLKEFNLPVKSLLKLRVLYAHRERLTKVKHQLKLGMISLENYEHQLNKEAVSSSKKVIKQMDNEITKIEKSINETIELDSELKRNCQLLESIPGIGLQTITYFMIVSNGGKGFENARKFACYCGVAPFAYSSGKSVRGKTRVSYLANRKMKDLLHMASLNAVRFDEEMKCYYERKLKEGKNPMSVLNAVKFKLIARMFSVLNRSEPFRKDYLKKAA